MAELPGPAPALRRGLGVLRLLAARPAPLSAAAIARELGLARSTVYELLGELAAAGFAVHLPDSRRWGLGVAAFEIGSAYLRSDPLERLGRPLLAGLARRTGGTAHLGVLHGAEMLYLAKERQPAVGGPTLVTDVGVRLPAQLTATGLSVLAHLPAEQVRAVFPGAESFVLRTGRGPADPVALRRRLAQVRRRGWADEDGQVSPDTASVAAAVFDHSARPTAAIGITVRHVCPAPDADCDLDLAAAAGAVRQAAAALTGAIGGRPAAG
jgi:DNA-binding IclR family transcriptional regulator